MRRAQAHYPHPLFPRAGAEAEVPTKMAVAVGQAGGLRRAGGAGVGAQWGGGALLRGILLCVAASGESS